MTSTRKPNEVKRKRRPPAAGAGRPRAARRGAASLLARLVLRIGRTVVGVLPRHGRVRAANDPEA